jgi:membrane protein implicated in regulation of membrane protease activity
MHTPGDENDQSLGATAREVAEHASTLARLELELAGLELKSKLTALAVGIGLAVGAALLALYGLGFALAGAASGLATAVPMWAALLIVAGALFAIVAILAFLAMRSFQRGAPPVPEQAIEEAKMTQEALTRNGVGS